MLIDLIVVTKTEEVTEKEANGNNGHVLQNGAKSSKSSELELEEPSKEEEDFSSWSEMKLEEQLRKLFDMISITMEERAKRIKLPKEIQEILRNTFSNCSV